MQICNNNKKEKKMANINFDSTISNRIADEWESAICYWLRIVFIRIRTIGSMLLTKESGSSCERWEDENVSV